MEQQSDVSVVTEKEPLISSSDSSRINRKAGSKVWQFVTCQEFPYSVFFIVGNEFCERFSYYGMRAVLVLYLTNYLNFNEDTATALYHSFIVLCFATPLLGAIIADSLLGKFKTIIILSIVYAVGNIVLSLSAMPPVLDHNEAAYKIVTFGGLILIALGTGGIKPCVAAFGGDQFRIHQMDLLSKFFSVFYLSINAGSFISTVLTPVLRGDVSCFNGEGCSAAKGGDCGGRDCYALAFGVPAILMTIAIIIFIAGSQMYIKNKPPGGNNIFSMFFGCLWTAIRNKIASRGSSINKNKKFIHYACPDYSVEFANDVWAVLRIFVMFLPLPVFWSLFDQQGSRWTLQATRMNGDVGGLNIKPDQMQALNSVLILPFIPLFEVFIYPFLSKFRLLRKPLERMVVGMLLAGSAFMVAGFIQLDVEATGFYPPVGGEARVTFTNVLPDSSVMVQIDNDSMFSITSDQSTMLIIKPNITYTVMAIPTNELYNSTSVEIDFEDQSLDHVLIGLNEEQELDIIPIPGSFDDVSDDDATVRVINGVSGLTGELSVELYDPNDCEDNVFTTEELVFGQYQLFKNIDVAEYSYVINNVTTQEGMKSICGDTEFIGGGVYSVIVTRYNSNFQATVVKTSEPNSVSILAQIPMYVLITAGEIMFSITGLQFAYSQAPASMKSFCQAGWLLTICVGNIIDVIVSQSQLIEDQAAEFFFFAGLITLMAVVLAVMSLFYKYVPLSQGVPEAVKKTHSINSDEETMGLLDSNSSNYGAVIKTGFTKL